MLSHLFDILVRLLKWQSLKTERPCIGFEESIFLDARLLRNLAELWDSLG